MKCRSQCFCLFNFVIPIAIRKNTTAHENASQFLTDYAICIFVHLQSTYPNLRLDKDRVFNEFLLKKIHLARDVTITMLVQRYKLNNLSSRNCVESPWDFMKK